jgi:hypothetical protein
MKEKKNKGEHIPFELEHTTFNLAVPENLDQLRSSIANSMNPKITCDAFTESVETLQKIDMYIHLLAKNNGISKDQIKPFDNLVENMQESLSRFFVGNLKNIDILFSTVDRLEGLSNQSIDITSQGEQIAVIGDIGDTII